MSVMLSVVHDFRRTISCYKHRSVDMSNVVHVMVYRQNACVKQTSTQECTAVSICKTAVEKSEIYSLLSFLLMLEESSHCHMRSIPQSTVNTGLLVCTCFVLSTRSVDSAYLCVLVALRPTAAWCFVVNLSRWPSKPDQRA